MQNTFVDERASFAVASPYPGPLAGLFKAMKKVGLELQLSSGSCLPQLGNLA